MAFGDLFLEEVRRYRETQLAGTGLAPVVPLWACRRICRQEMKAGQRALPDLCGSEAGSRELCWTGIRRILTG